MVKTQEWGSSFCSDFLPLVNEKEHPFIELKSLPAAQDDQKGGEGEKVTAPLSWISSLFPGFLSLNFSIARFGTFALLLVKSGPWIFCWAWPILVSLLFFFSFFGLLDQSPFFLFFLCYKR